MKTGNDPRHIERVKLMQDLFAYGFNKTQEVEGKKLKLILSNMTDIDNWIGKAAPKWTVEKINRLDLAILRLSVYELLVEKSSPPKVVVDESVELAKEYGSESSPSFINGALGKLIQDNNLL